MKRITIFIFVLLGALTLSAKSKYNLQYDLKKGKSYIVEISATTQTAMEVSAQGNTQKNTMAMDIAMTLDYEIIDATSEVYWASVCYRRMALTIDMGSERMTFDSEKSADDDMLKGVLGKMIGQKFRMQMDKKGNVLGIDGLDTLIAHIGGVEDAQAKQILEAFNEKSLKETFSQNFSYLPKEAVAVGYSWNVDYSTTQNGIEYEVKGIYTLKDVTADNYKLENKSIFKMKSDTLQREASVKLDGNMQSVVVLDRKTCWISAMNTNGLLLMNMNNAGMDMNANIKLKVKGTGGEK